MSLTNSSSPRRRRARLALAAALVAVGCSGGTGGGCGSSCGGAFKTVDSQGRPFKFNGSRLDNVAQVRLTQSGFSFLNASHLNDILGSLNSGGGGLGLPCIEKDNLVSACLSSSIGLKVSLLVGDTDFNGQCDAADHTPLHITFKDVSWILDATNNALKAHLVMHLKTGDIYVHTKEEHSTLCNGTSAIQLRTFYDDEAVGLPQQDTVVDLAIGFTTTPDGRLEINFDNSSLDAIVGNFQPGALFIDGAAGTDPAPAATGSYSGNGCDSSASGSYSVLNGSNLNCSGFFQVVGACDPNSSNGGTICPIIEYIRGYLFDYLKNSFKTQIVNILRTQLDNARCQRSTDSQGKPVACDSSHLCPADDDGHALKCDTTRGVCYPPAQGDPPANFNCEPIPLAIAGEMDVSQLTDKVGFPPNTKLDIFAGLGSKTGAGTVDTNGLQLAAQAGTSPASNILSLCVPPPFPPTAVNPPPMDFESSANKPAGVTTYDAAFSLASAMLNRGFLDAYSAGLLCVAVTNKTTSFISSGLFKTFLPSLGLVTGGKDVPMMILLRPTQPPYVRVGRNTTKTNPDGTTSPDDPLITLSLKQMNLDFYALVDERQVRIFTLQADMQLPLGMRTFADPNSDTLQPVLGGLDTLLTNISALSPKGGAYGPTDMLAEDPGVVKDLLGAAVRLAQPLLAGVIKPVVLPTMMGLRFGIEGVAGAVPMPDVVNDGYHHLALWAKVNECGTGCGPVHAVRTEVRVAGYALPESGKEVREGKHPSLALVLSAKDARQAEFSYRVDGSLWSPWIGHVSLLTLRDPLFLVPGHHLVEVTSREAGDDYSMDRSPVAVDFFVSYEAPAVSLAQRGDGAVVTRARSAAASEQQLQYSYRVDGEETWSQASAAHVFSLDELRGRGLTVSVSDEAGRTSQAHFGDD